MSTATRLLDPAIYRPLVEQFNADDRCPVVNDVPNAQAFDWMAANCPVFDCPDAKLREIYAFRWWVYRKHIKTTPAGRIVTEFITPVTHGGQYNAISCALGLHIAEGRWLRDQAFLDEYVNFWFTAGEDGGPARKFHNYSSWLHWAEWERYLVTGDRAGLAGQLDRFVADYAQWEAEKQLPNGLFWQYDVRDGMEESITGSRTHKNARPTINSYMFANARAIASIATLAGKPDVAATFAAKAARLKQLVHETLWDREARFFKAQFRENGLSDAREAIGFVPWCFDLPDTQHEEAWVALIDKDAFWAPAGITTAERRHPMFRSHGVGQCEWDGAVWPFATSQTLVALANVLRHYNQPHVTRRHWFAALFTYARHHEMYGKPYIGEYHDEITGHWLKGDNPRSIHYNHSTFADLVIHGLVGLVPREDGRVEVDPLLPADTWKWFCLDGVRYRGRDVTVIWDEDGSRYGKGVGLAVLADGERVAHAATLTKVVEGGSR
jgi:hypothetical protein